MDANSILDAAAHLVERAGFRGVTLAEVAHRAGVSRRTVYRYFGDRDGLLDGLIGRERDRFVTAALDAAGPDDDLRTAASRSILAILTLAVDSRLLAKLRSTDPELLHPRFAARSGTVIDVVTPTTTAFLAHYLPDADPALGRVAADLISRLLVSYVADPPTGPISSTAEAIAQLLVSMLETAQSSGVQTA